MDQDAFPLTDRVAVDFESMNPPARRFWMKHFQPVSYALARVVEAEEKR